MNSLQKEIYKTYKLYKQDKSNKNFYDTYIGLIVGDYPEQKDYYYTYWESLKKYGDKDEHI